MLLGDPIFDSSQMSFHQSDVFPSVSQMTLYLKLILLLYPSIYRIVKCSHLIMKYIYISLFYYKSIPLQGSFILILLYYYNCFYGVAILQGIFSKYY